MERQATEAVGIELQFDGASEPVGPFAYRGYLNKDGQIAGKQRTEAVYHRYVLL